MRRICSVPLLALVGACALLLVHVRAVDVDHLSGSARYGIHDVDNFDTDSYDLPDDSDAHHVSRHSVQAPSGQWHQVHTASRVHVIPRMPAHPLSEAPLATADEPVMLERSSTTSHIAMAADLGAEAGLAAALAAMGTVAISADAAAEQQAILQEPGVKAALSAKTPDAVDKLIQGILDGTGKGGVVTSEFNQNGVHATIISNVNELRVTQLVDAAQAGDASTASPAQVAPPATPRFRSRRHRG